MTKIEQINYRNPKMAIDFEIVDLQLFYNTRPHHHITRDYRLNFWLILYVTEGQGHHSVDFVEYPLKEGDVVFVQKNQVHHFMPSSTLQGYIIHVNEPFFYKLRRFDTEMFLEFVDSIIGSAVMSTEPYLRQVSDQLLLLLYDEYSKREEFFDIELIATLFQSFIISLKRQVKDKQMDYACPDYERFKLFRRLLEAHYDKVKDVESYAQMMHITKKTLNQTTRKIVDQSAKTYINNRIVLEIKRLLSQDVLLNYEIADMLGFDEAANMSRFFKRYTGVSPKAFKEAVLK